jgi:hypothetical protein
LLDQGKPGRMNVTASGERSIAIGGNVTRTAIITGDQNEVGYNIKTGDVET